MYRIGFFDILEENKPFILCKEFQLSQINGFCLFVFLFIYFRGSPP